MPRYTTSCRCLRVRDEAYAAGEKISDTEVQRRVITLAKATSACGVKDGPKSLGVRQWTCPAESPPSTAGRTSKS